MDEATWEARRGAMMDKIAADIERVGWSSVGVFPTADAPELPSFTYTIGLRETHDHPELIVYGMRPEMAHGVLAGAIDLIKAGTRFEDGRRYGNVLEGFDVLARAIPEPGYPLNIARAHYDSDVSAVQLVWPDEAGVFPLEPGFDPRFNGAQVFPDGTKADA